MRKQIFYCLIFLLVIVGGQVARAQNRTVLVLEAEGPVTPAMFSYFERGIQTAEREDAAAVLIILDTPGGNLDPTQNIVWMVPGGGDGPNYPNM